MPQKAIMIHDFGLAWHSAHIRFITVIKLELLPLCRGGLRVWPSIKSPFSESSSSVTIPDAKPAVTGGETCQGQWGRTTQP